MKRRPGPANCPRNAVIIDFGTIWVIENMLSDGGITFFLRNKKESFVFMLKEACCFIISFDVLVVRP